MTDRKAPAASTRRGRSFFVLLLLELGGCGDAVPQRNPDDAELLHRILIAEDDRRSDPPGLGPVEEGLASPNPEIRRIAVRSLGRLEQPLADQIAPLLEDSVPAVRAEAANALAQSVFQSEPAPARTLLLEHLALETDYGVRGALAQSLGRIRHASASDVAGSSAAMTQPATGAEDRAPFQEHQVRVAKGLYLLARQPAAREALDESALTWLRAALGAAGTPEDSLSAERTRTLAFAALAASGHATADDFGRAMADENPLVRREAMAAPRGLAQMDSAMARGLVGRGLADASPMVRYQALSAWQAMLREPGCDAPRRLARDPDAHVSLHAIDLLGECPPDVARALLDSLVTSLNPSVPTGWHMPAHALVSLAAVDGPLAAQRLSPFVTHPNGFARAYAARAAGAVRQADAARSLVGDPDPNVRTAAIESLSAIDARGADSILIAQLELNDPQLIMTAARLLAGTREPSARPALLGAFERLTAERRETSRDARLALLERIRELGTADDLPRIQPALQDFDPEVAASAAEVIGAWTGTPPASAPAALPHAPVPTPARLDSLEGSVFTVTMADGGSFDVRLRAWDAPTNADRFARLAESGYFDGLTYHRVAPNFVIQGGSPAANEYAGDGPFTRDELGLDGHWRGTLGISTRGHDTGDAQMFVNLIDNVRLDHQYTVFAEVARGMEVVDRVLEGDVIQTIRRAASR